jgi:large subunit ribosomal protein L29
MAKKKENKNNLIGKTAEELKTMLADARKDLFNLRLDNSQRKLKNTSSLTAKRKEIARVLTKIREIA